MYGDLAHLWPLISPPEEYADEAAHWRDALRARLGPGRHRLLDLGVGGGHNLSHLTDDFEATAVDLSPRMLELSARLNPGVEHHVGDMRTVRLGRTFDAVLIHDAVSYLLTEEDLRATFETARAHLAPGGVLIVAPDWYRETWKGTEVFSRVRRAEGRELVFVEYRTDLDPNDTTVETVFLYITNEGGEIRIERDHHVMGLFSMDIWLGRMRDAGFDVERRPYLDRADGNAAYLLVGVFAAWPSP
jgi:SAM-dependent methyltransferase